jgi:hypothetical protein
MLLSPPLRGGSMRSLIVSALLAPLALFAATSTTAVSTTASDAKMIGIAELRPSYGSVLGEFHTENNAILGYQFSKDTNLVYKQEFFTNLYHPGTRDGMTLEARDGYFRGNITNIWTNGPWGLNYEGRLYLPTYASRREAGMIVAARNYAHLGYRFSGAFTLILSEAPVFHVYDVAGYKKAANPWYENKVELTGVYKFSDNTRLIVPLKFSSLKYRNFAKGAKYNDAWGHTLVLWPELWHRLDSTFQVGAAYYTGSLIQDNFGATTIENGFKTGVAQLIFAANL